MPIDISSLQLNLSDSQANDLTRLQRELHEEFLTGKSEVRYMDEVFQAFPGVFPPRPDSVALVQGMEIKRGDRVIDVCCGSGVIGIFAALQGASQVVGLDINQEAVRCANENARQKEIQGYEARVSDVLSGLSENDGLFNLAFFNPPYRDLPTTRPVEQTTWDTGLRVHEQFFSKIREWLLPPHKVQFAQANFGPLDRVSEILNRCGWSVELTGVRPLNEIPELRFYSFQATAIL